MNSYNLSTPPVRRVGLTRAGYKGPPLLQSFNAANADHGEKMPKQSNRLKAEPMKQKPNDPTWHDTLRSPGIHLDADKKVGKVINVKENLLRPPDSSSDEDEEDRKAADIKPTKFKRESEEVKSRSTKGRAGAGGDDPKSKPKNATVNGRENGTSSSSSPAPKSPKRKSQDSAWPGVDPFGRPQQKKVKATYGSRSQPRLPSSQSSQKSKKPADAGNSPKKAFKIPDLMSLGNSQDAEDSPDKPRFKAPETFDDSPVRSDSGTGDGFKRPDKLEDTPSSTPGSNRKFQIPTQFDSPSPSGAKGKNLFANLTRLGNPPISTPAAVERFMQNSAPPNPLNEDIKKRPEFRKYDLGEDLDERVHHIVKGGEGALETARISLSDNDYDTSITEGARCPMCNQLVDADELQKYGTMNTRQQERFCRSHQKKNAEDNWASKGYPEIDWEKLDSRISKHHSFIKDLFNGADSHYRAKFEEMVASGKGRTLRKMDSSLTPGYYGARGMNTISEHIIREFSSLLQERSVKDRLMSKRGSTAFVQSVIVFEVAVQLIMEDMKVSVDEARDILTESSNIGELVHEEVQDVVMEKVKDSEDEDDEDDDDDDDV